MRTALLQAFAGFNALLSLATAYVSDLVSAQHRASAIGLIMAAFSVGLLFGPLMGGFLGTVVASALSVVGTSLALLLLIFTVPESLSQASKEGVSSILLCPSLRSIVLLLAPTPGLPAASTDVYAVFIQCVGPFSDDSWNWTSHTSFR